MNAFETFNQKTAYYNLILEAKQDYKPELVKMIDSKFLLDSPFLEKQLKNVDITPIDIGLSELVPLFTSVKACVLAASLQYCFWEINQTKGLIRYAIDNKSGSEIINSFISDHVNFCVSVNKNPFTNYSHHYLDLESLPLGNERIKDMHEVIIRFDPKELIENILDLNKVTIHQALVLNKQFETFQDPYLKKAQLALSFIVGYLNKMGYNIDQSELTIFADYQVPRVMQKLGLLEYDATLRDVIENNGLILENSVTEKAIRAATILMGEKLSNFYNVPAASIDKFLWLQRKTCTLPHHLTITKRY